MNRLNEKNNARPPIRGNRPVLCLLAGAAMLASGTAAAGPRLFGGEASGGVTITSDYLFRGVSQTGEDPTLQGSIDWSHDSGFYLGVWGSGLDFGGDESVELDYYAGYAAALGGFDLDAGIIYYHYPGTAADLDFVEFTASASKRIEAVTLDAGVNYSPDNFAGSGDAVYVHGGAEAAIPLQGAVGLSVGATLGYQAIEKEAVFGLPDYAEWSAGATFTYKGFALDLRYHDTDLGAACGAACDSRFVVSGGYSF